MARNTSVSLGDHFEEFIAGQVDSGRYGSASEVVRAGLRLLETNESRLEVLRNALVAGERSGRAKYSYESLVSELDVNVGVKGFDLTRLAQADLKSIARFTQERWGVRQRNAYLKEIDQVFRALARNPIWVAACDE